MMKIIEYKKFIPKDISTEYATKLYSKVWGTVPTDFQERFIRHQSYPRFSAFGAYSEGVLVGLVYGYASQPGQYYHDKLANALKEKSEWLNETMELVELLVDPEFRGQGIGKQLVANWLAPLHGRILLTTKNDNIAAHHLYKQLGFEVIKEDFQPTGTSNWYIYGKLLPWVLPALETERLLLRHWREDDFLSAGDTYAIEWKETGTVIGGIGLHDRRPDEELRYLSQREIGYVLSPKFWGKGIMPEAVNKVLRHGFEDMNLDIIWCGHFDFNDNSRRVVEKTGFRYVKTKPQVLPRLNNLEVQNLLYIQTQEDYFNK